jgi:hypothetical protein
MASWMVHFRISDRLLEVLDVNKEQFIVGNIGPDCGEPDEDWRVFTPSANITHGKDTEDKSGIDSEAFYEAYIKNNMDLTKISFYLGYYVHLVTDILWRSKIALPIEEKYKEYFEKDKNFIWVVKKDWYDLDHKFLRDHNDFRAFRIFDKITSFPNIYLDYYSDLAIEKQIKYISGFYNNEYEDLDREYQYLTEAEINDFIEETTEVIIKELITKNCLAVTVKQE